MTKLFVYVCLNCCRRCIKERMKIREKLYRRFAIVCIGAATLGLLGGWLFFCHPTSGQSAVQMQELGANAKKSGVISPLFGFTPFPYDWTLEA
ncbi:MAG: hypothetical protein AAB116_21175, partial [Candidatus Poribacteria bacterium]